MRARREHLGLTLQQLADRMETDPRQARRIERGEANLGVDSLLKLSGALGVPLAQLFAFQLPPPAPPILGEPPPLRRSPLRLAQALAQEVVRLRLKAGLTQQDLARRSGASLSLVRGVENARNSPTLRSLEAIADALDVELADLLTSSATG